MGFGLLDCYISMEVSESLPDSPAHGCLADHTYAKSWNWSPSHILYWPTKYLFTSREIHIAHTSGANEGRLDVEMVVSESEPPFDAIKAETLLEEAVKEAEKVCCNGVDDQDWEKSVDQLSWTSEQRKLFSKVTEILNAVYLSMLSSKGSVHCAAVYRSRMDSCAKQFCRLMCQDSMEVKLGGWLHVLLMKHLSPSYLALYMELLQALRAKSPGVFDSVTSEARMADSMMDFLEKKPWDPAASSLSHLKLTKPRDGITILFLHGSLSKKQRASMRMQFWIDQLSHMGRVIPVTLASLDDNGRTRSLDAILSSLKSHVSDAKTQHPDKPLVIVGWGTWAALTSHVCLEEAASISAVVCLGFPTRGIFGARGEADDPLLFCKVPFLFILGSQAINARISDIERLREKMKCQTRLIVLEGGDHWLRLPKGCKVIHHVTQGMVDKALMMEVADFISLVLSPPPDVLTSLTMVPGSNTYMNNHHLPCQSKDIGQKNRYSGSGRGDLSYDQATKKNSFEDTLNNTHPYIMSVTSALNRMGPARSRGFAALQTKLTSVPSLRGRRAPHKNSSLTFGSRLSSWQSRSPVAMQTSKSFHPGPSSHKYHHVILQTGSGAGGDGGHQVVALNSSPLSDERRASYIDAGQQSSSITGSPTLRSLLDANSPGKKVQKTQQRGTFHGEFQRLSQLLNNPNLMKASSSTSRVENEHLANVPHGSSIRMRLPFRSDSKFVAAIPANRAPKTVLSTDFTPGPPVKIYPVREVKPPVVKLSMRIPPSPHLNSNSLKSFQPCEPIQVRYTDPQCLTTSQDAISSILEGSHQTEESQLRSQQQLPQDNSVEAVFPPDSSMLSKVVSTCNLETTPVVLHQLPSLSHSASTYQQDIDQREDPPLKEASFPVIDLTVAGEPKENSINLSDEVQAIPEEVPVKSSSPGTSQDEESKLQAKVGQDGETSGDEETYINILPPEKNHMVLEGDESSDVSSRRSVRMQSQQGDPERMGAVTRAVKRKAQNSPNPLNLTPSLVGKRRKVEKQHAALAVSPKLPLLRRVTRSSPHLGTLKK
ncbi:unnamed protein product [Darwinula stevensoni]|uniref:KANSL3 helical domain-containing protein n=1 Tax=Darwinula stevensoni TaxID=69355 RepID=A0A7R9A3U1_9CRUS|nr:unnamed protein product [Darwinula stevensoni]CAG0891279.1 unnamed protein product [Darwinula stevensoni]